MLPTLTSDLIILDMVLLDTRMGLAELGEVVGAILGLGLSLYISVCFVSQYQTIPLCHPTLG